MKKFLGIFLLGTVTCVIFSAAVNAQTAAETAAKTIGSVSISSPTAASLGKFGDIPVSYFTGIPQIDIPFYTVQAGNLKLPISLSYHASGVKVQEPAGWVGAGWALNAGGVITRTVCGQPDESGINSGIQLNGHFSHYGYNSYLYGGAQEDWLGFAEGRKDGEPDLFFFNFNGYSGKFYFRDDRTPIIVPQQDLRIIPSYSGGRSIDYFTVITPDGSQYFFGNSPGVTGAIPIETTNAYSPKNGTQSAPPTSSWYLNKIVSKDSQFSITLTYTAESYGYYTVAMFPVDGASAPPQEYDLVKNIIQGVKLSQINFPNGTVTFNSGAARTDLSDAIAPYSDQTSTATSLASIQIADNTGFCKQFSFYYGYFSGDNSSLPVSLTAGMSITTDQARLRLDSVQEKSCNLSVIIPSYKFSYYSGQVPRRLSFGIDHWGFYNGINNNPKLTPTIVVDGTTINGANRDAGSLSVMEAGSLQKITYPTSGTTQFVYETNAIFSTSTYLTSSLLANLVANLYGQPNTMTSPSFHSDGTTITGIFNNSTDNQTGTITINNSVGQQVYNYPVPPSTSVSPTFTLPAGNYTATVSVPSGATGGMQAYLTQQVTVTVSGNTPVGGLRIASITSSDGLGGPDQVTNYSYNNPGGNSTAYLYSVPVYAQAIRNDMIKNVGYWSVTGFQNYVVGGVGCPVTNGYFQSPSSIRPMSTVQGNHIGYSLVTVTKPNNGKSVYSYYVTDTGFPAPNGDVCVRNISTSCSSTVPNYPSAPLPFDSKRGELNYEQHFDNNGQLLKDIYYYPVYDLNPILTTPGFIVFGRHFGPAYQLLGTFYTLNTVRKNKMTTVEDYYQPGVGFVTKTSITDYASHFHNQPTRITTLTSTGDSLFTNMRYTSDFRIASCDAISDCSTEYNSSCATCQSQYNSAIASCGGSGSCLSTAYVTFLQCNTNARASYVSCRNTNYMNVNSTFNTCIISAEGTADGNLKPVLQLQDEFRITPIEVTNWKNSNLLRANFTKYDYVTSPSGIPYPNKTQLISLQAPSSTFTNAAVSGTTTITKDNRYSDENLYTFAAGNLQYVTPHDGITVAYLWDYLNSQPIAKVTNTTVDQIAHTSFESNGKGGWAFSGIPAVDATAITGVKTYSLNSGSITKSGLSTSKSFILSYWSKTTSATVNGATAPAGPVKRGWVYFEHKLAPGISTVTVSGTVTIDELRLYPSDAQMTTYTYTPLLGMTTTCDVNNRITYFAYDDMGRLKSIKDQDGNIKKTVQYNYMNQPTAP